MRRPHLRLVFAVLVAALLGAVPSARAAEITFATLASEPGFATVFLNTTTFDVSSFDIPLPLDPGDPFASSAPVRYTVEGGGTLPAFFKMGPVAFNSVVGPGHSAYGPGSFAIGINTGTPNSLAWLNASFTDANLTLTPDLLNGALFNFNGVTFSGLGFDITGLDHPGSFALGLSNPVSVTDGQQNVLGLGYQVTGAFAAQQVPEPVSVLLFGTGAVAVCYRRRSTARAHR